MEYHLHDIRQLHEMLEAEAVGQPFDRARAHALATFLGQRQPEIRNSMSVICERLKQGETR